MLSAKRPSKELYESSGVVADVVDRARRHRYRRGRGHDSPAVDCCTTFTAFEQVRHIPGKLYMGGTTTMDPPAKAQGWITAVDASTGAVKWRYRSPRPMVAAVTTTAGNVVFAGELTGDFLTLDARTGDVLYRFNTGGPMGGGVVTYRAGGRQYVAVASGSPSNFWVAGNAGSPTIVAFALPR